MITAAGTTSAMLPHTRYGSGGGSMVAAPPSRAQPKPFKTPGMGGACCGSCAAGGECEGESEENGHLDSADFKTPGRSSCGSCGRAGGRPERRPRQMSYSAGFVGESTVLIQGKQEKGPAKPPADYGDVSPFNSSISIKRSKKCDSKIYLHLWLDDSKCKKPKLLKWVKDQFDAGAKKKLNKTKSCLCKDYNHYTKVGMEKGAKQVCKPVPKSRNACRYSIHIKWHDKNTKGADGIDPLDVTIDCTGAVDGNPPWVTDADISLWGWLDPGKFIAGGAGWKSAAMIAALAVHELAHNLFVDLPGDWHPDAPFGTQEQKAKAGHPKSGGGLLRTKAPQGMIREKMSKKEMCQLICVLQVCVMEECCGAGIKKPPGQGIVKPPALPDVKFALPVLGFPVLGPIM